MRGLARWGFIPGRVFVYTAKDVDPEELRLVVLMVLGLTVLRRRQG